MHDVLPSMTAEIVCLVLKSTPVANAALTPPHQLLLLLLLLLYWHQSVTTSLTDTAACGDIVFISHLTVSLTGCNGRGVRFWASSWDVTGSILIHYKQHRDQRFSITGETWLANISHDTFRWFNIVDWRVIIRKRPRSMFTKGTWL